MNSLILNSKDEIHVVQKEKIIYCKSNNVYSTVFLIDGTIHTICKPISKFLDELANDDFIRVNQSYLINRKQISHICKKNRNIFLLNGIKIHFTMNIKELLTRVQY